MGWVLAIFQKKLYNKKNEKKVRTQICLKLLLFESFLMYLKKLPKKIARTNRRFVPTFPRQKKPGQVSTPHSFAVKTYSMS